ncbi:hypothetical protein [uncultured Methanobrevibacter sp.]|uniref:hypothetical protein n=1 Tax=uncultured Methanobrevibacter sp. TaxID=253161 RepID=UPI0025CD85D5|nr:hypothetical protein [uncultured Methanobrevibacter sp.]
MSKEKWVESLLDDMIESRWSEDVIKHEIERLSDISDFEPINQYSDKELDDSELIKNDFNTQIENFSKSDYKNYLISQAVDEIGEEIDFSNDYLEGLIRQHLDEENDFLDRVMKEAIAEDDYFQKTIERKLAEERYHEFYDKDELYVVEYPGEKEIFDDLGDTSYMDQGIFEGANTDRFEEPFKYMYYENQFFDDDLVDYSPDDIIISDYDASQEHIDISEAPDDILLDEPAGENLQAKITERLIEEKYLDRVFVEIIKRDSYWDNLIEEKLASDGKLNQKIEKLH